MNKPTNRFAPRTKRGRRDFKRHRENLRRCPKHGVTLTGIWHRRGICPVCWAANHPLQGYCMLCGNPTRMTWRENILCDQCENEFRRLFGRKRLRVPLRSVNDVRDVVAFTARRIYTHLDALDEAAEAARDG